MKLTQMYNEIMQEKVVAEYCINGMEAQLDLAAKKIKEFGPYNVVFAARGTSCNAAKLAKYLIETHIGWPVSIAAPSVLTKYNGKLNLSNSLVIGISQSGAAEDVCSVLRRANENGALTIAITNTEESLLMKNAKISINCNSGSELSVAATKTFVAQMAVLAVLVAKISGDKDLQEHVNRIPEAIEQAFALKKQVEELSQRYRYLDECVVLARGIAYPIALELAIKLQETCYVRATGFALSNFAHGPLAILHRSMGAILLAIDKNTDDNVPEMQRRIAAMGTEILLITNKRQLVKTNVGRVILLPDWCEGVCGVFAVTTMVQLLACGISSEKSINPDSPRCLTKVTVTK